MGINEGLTPTAKNASVPRFGSTYQFGPVAMNSAATLALTFAFHSFFFVYFCQVCLTVNLYLLSSFSTSFHHISLYIQCLYGLNFKWEVL